MIFRSLLAAAALLFAVPSAHAAFDVGDIICETSTTTGTGTLDLAGAVANYLTFVTQIASGNTVPYHIRASDGKLETGIGTFTDASPDTLSRTADWSTDGSGAELTLPAGTHTVCLGPISSSIVHNPSVASIQFAADATQDIGTSSVGINDLHIGGTGGVINFDGGDVTITHAANDLAFAGVTGDYSFDDTVGITGSLTASVDVTATAGDVTSGDDVISGDDVLLSDTGVINFNAGDCTLTEGTNTLTIAGTCTLTTEVVVPDGDNTRDLGSTGATWATAHINSIELANGTANTLTASAGTLSIEGVALVPASRTITGGVGISAMGDLSSDRTVTFDATEISSLTWGAGAFTDMTFSGAGAIDLTWNYATSSTAILSHADAGAVGPILRLHHNSTSSADGDISGAIEVAAGADDEVVSAIRLEVDDGSTTSEDVHWQMWVDVGGALVQRFTVGVSDAGAAGLSVSQSGIGSVDDGVAFRWFETEANGDNFKGFVSASANTADTTCTFENDANFVPDSCVGDGSDASDGRLKDIIGPAGDVGGMIDGIKIYNFKWNTDAPEASEAIRKDKRGFGPVAQELFNINPDWVEVGGDDPIKDPWTWKPEKVVPYLIVEVQNLRKRLANHTCYGIKLGSACIGVSM
jgi:hypothetical protein